jgi:Spy/CpxP family protein refolding chaperone
MPNTGKKYGYVLAGVAAAALAVTMVLAGQHGRQAGDQTGDPHGPGFGHGGVFGMEDGHLVHVLSKLNLTDDQKAQLKSTLLADGPTMEPLLEASMQAHRALGETMHASTFDAKAVKTAADALGAAESNLAVERARLFSSVQTTILTDDQRQTLQTMKQNMQQHMQQHMEQNAGQPRNLWADHVNALIGAL